MTTPSTTIYVRPGWASSTWTYAGNTLPSGPGTSAIAAVAFDASGSLGQQLNRGELQYSLDNGKTWIPYAAPTDGQGAYVSVTGTLWRFQDRTGADAVTPNTFSAHYRLADGSIVTQSDTVIPDNSPVGLTGHNDLLFTTLRTGDVVDTLTPMDTGSYTGGRWVIDSQSQPGLFSIAYNPATDGTAKLVLANSALLPAGGLSATVTVHYYDRYQLDTAGNPAAGTGVSRTLAYMVEDGVSHGLSSATADLRVATATPGGAPALAKLSTGGFAAVWQGPDTAAGGAGTGLWAQLRDASGNALGSAFAVTPNGDARVEGEPAVAALANGRFAVAWSMVDGGVAKIAYRVVEANGALGAEHVLASGARGDAAMPAIAALADGSFAVAWRAGGAVHVQGVAASGATAGAVQDYAALGSAYSPSLAPLGQAGYVVGWGEMNDGNVWAATSSAHAPFVVSGDGYAASISTAAPLPHVAALAGGGFVVAWDSYVHEPRGFTMSDIFYQRYDATAHALGPVAQANVNSTGGLFDAAVTGLSDGGFLVAWQGSDDDGNGVYGRRFGADGKALDSQDVQINQLRAGDQSAPDVVALSGGGFAAAWLDTSATGAAGIEARVLPGVAASTTGAAMTSPLSSGSSGTGSPATAPAGSPSPSPSAPVASAPVSSAPVASAPAPSAPSAPVSSGSSTSTSAAAVAVAKLAGSAADNVMRLPAGVSELDGGGGIDTLLAVGTRAANKIVKTATGFTLTGAGGDKASLVNVERIQFSDGDVALDVHGNGGEAYRLYQAAFNRVPDKVGLGYWIAALDSGKDLSQVAAAFTGSLEFAHLYGANSTDAQFVQALYQNVLHRAPDSEGYAYWQNCLHIATRGDVLASFSESPENQAQVIGSIQNGIDFTHWG